MHMHAYIYPLLNLINFLVKYYNNIKIGIKSTKSHWPSISVSILFIDVLFFRRIKFNFTYDRIRTLVHAFCFLAVSAYRF